MQSGAASLTETQVSTGDAGVSPAVNGRCASTGLGLSWRCGRKFIPVYPTCREYNREPHHALTHKILHFPTPPFSFLSFILYPHCGWSRMYLPAPVPQCPLDIASHLLFPTSQDKRREAGELKLPSSLKKLIPS